MKLLIVFLSYFTLFNSLIYSQQTDTLEVLFLQQKATKLYETFKYDNAAHYFFQVAKIYEQQKNRMKSVKNYRLTANSFNKSAKSDTALYFAQKALNIVNNHFIENTKTENFEKADIYITFGDINKALGKYNEALLCYENALNLVLQTDSLEKLKVAKIWNSIGTAYRYQGQYDKAFEFCEKSLEAIQLLQGNNHIDLAKPLSYLGVIYHVKGSYDKALEYFHKVLEITILNYGEDHPDVAITYNNIGNIYRNKGDSDKSLEYFSKSLSIAIQIHGEFNHLTEKLYLNIGNIYLFKGDFVKALTYFQKSLQITIQLVGENNPKLASKYYSIGNVHINMSNYNKALEFYQKSLQISLHLNDGINSQISSCYNNIAIVYRYKGDYDKALEYAQKALKLNILIYGYNKSNVAINYINIGNIYRFKNNYDKALEYYQKALKIRININGEQHYSAANNYNYIGLINSQKGDHNKALKYYQKALMANMLDFYDTNIYHSPKHFNAVSKPVLLNTLTKKAKSLFYLYKNTNVSNEDIKASVCTYELAFKLIYEMRNDYSQESMKLLISEENKKYFTDAIHAAVELNKVDPSIENKERTLEYIEKSKSATLSTYLNDLEIKQYWNIADSLLQQEKNIAINLREYETKIQKFKAPKGDYDTLLVWNYQDSLFNYSRQYDNLINTLEHNYPEYFALKYKQETAEIKNIQHELDNNSALINYFVGDTSLFICTITKEEYKIKTIKIDSLFNAKIIDYYIDVKSDFTEKELKSSLYFYNYLIEPIKEELKNKDNLIIIPNGNLYYIPFETLCNDDTYSKDLSSLNYLIKDYSITYNHTASLWLNGKEKEQNQFVTKDNFIGFAPIFDPKIDNGFIVSSEWIQDTTNTELASRSISNDLTHFNTLPYSENEVESIIRLFNKKRKEAKGFFYKEANEENFKHNIQNYKYIHIASHSFTNDLYPNLSGIAFSQPDTSAVYNEDGILYAGETYNLNLPKADLITLSSCKSGLGKLIQGEGFLSLSRGFLYSGTPNIIFSLWNVKDEPTKDLMIQFYKQVLQGTDYANALREAKIQLISNPKTASPKYWGAWMLVGR